MYKLHTMVKRIWFIAILIVAALFSVQAQKYALVIHGGAGVMEKNSMSAETRANYTSTLNEALKLGDQMLKDGATATDVVVKVINVMENSPLFNAGKGAVFNHEGINELDASIMEGHTLNAGAVAGVRDIKNPINAAREVMDNSAHVMLSGKGASEFAKKQGLEIVPNSYFYTKHSSG